VIPFSIPYKDGSSTLLFFSFTDKIRMEFPFLFSVVLRLFSAFSCYRLFPLVGVVSSIPPGPNLTANHFLFVHKSSPFLFPFFNPRLCFETLLYCTPFRPPTEGNYFLFPRYYISPLCSSGKSLLCCSSLRTPYCRVTIIPLTRSFSSLRADVPFSF